MEWLIAGIISISMHFYSFYTIGDLKSERDTAIQQYEAIAKQCSTDRDRERSATIESAQARARSEREEAQIMEDGQRHADSILRDAENTCLDSGFPGGYLLYLREGEERDSLNGVGVRVPSGVGR